MTDGYFGRESMARRVMTQRAVNLTYGQRALIVGALHPRLFQGTVQSTTHRDRPYTRLGLTARLFEAVFLGTKEEADRALTFTAKRHATVKGTIEEHAGHRHPAGAPYDAADPGLMWWTAAFTLDSAEVMHDRLVRRLTAGEREALFQDFVTWAELFGMPRSAAPSSYDDFRATFDAFLASDEPHLTAEARQIGRYLAGVDGTYPVPVPSRPAFEVLNRVIVASLPPKAQDLYGLRPTGVDRAVTGVVSLGSRQVHQRVPLLPATPLLRGPAREFYKVPAATEQANLRRGRTSMPGISDRSVDASPDARPA